MDVRRFAYAVKETLGLAAYTHTQTYHITLTVRIDSDQSPRSGVTVIPLPQQTDYQHITETIHFSDERLSHAHDAHFGNEYALFSWSLSAGESASVTMHAGVSVRPRRSSRVAHGDAGRADSHCLSLSDARIKAISRSVCGSTASSNEKIKKLNAYVVQSLTYGNPQKGLYTASEALDRDTVDCGGFDTLLCSLCIAAGIRARVVSGFWPGTDALKSMHAWCEIMLENGVWIPADPSIEQLVLGGRDRTKSGHLGFVGSDRVMFSVGCDIPIRLPDGTEQTIDLLQFPVSFPSSSSIRTHYELSIASL